MNTAIYDDIYERYKGRIFLFYVCGWIAVTAIEVMVGILFTGGEWMAHYYFLRVFIPAGTNALMMAITLILLNNKNIKFEIKNYAIVCSLVLMSLVLCICHGYYMALLGAFIIPILVSIAFTDYKIFIFAIISSISGVIISTIVIWFLEHDTVRKGNIYIWPSAVIIVLLLILASAISIMIIRLREGREKILMKAQEENAMLSKQNRVDGLTNLQNHTSFYTVLENKLLKARHDKRGFAIAILDIDDFKNVNDTYGHATGDEILKRVASVIVTAIGNMGVPFRYGGDEFAIIFNNPNPEVNVNALETLRRSIANIESFFTDGTRVTISVGYYNVQEASMSAEEIFFKADQALYMAKYNGKNQVYSDF